VNRDPLQVLDSELAASADWGLPGLSGPPAEYNKKWMAQHAGGSVQHAAAAAEALSLISGILTLLTS